MSKKSHSLYFNKYRDAIDRLAYTLSLALINIGVLGLLWSISPFATKSSVLAQSQSAVTTKPINQPKKQTISGKPIRLILKDENIDLEIKEGFYNPADQSWTIGNFAYYATPSVYLNNSGGNTLIYGHNNPIIFAKLSRLKNNEKLLVYSDNGLIFNYIYTSAEEITPDNVSVFSQNGKPTVTLQTCSGNWYEKRTLYSFKLDKIEKI